MWPQRNRPPPMGYGGAFERGGGGSTEHRTENGGLLLFIREAEVSETSFPRFLLLWKAGALVWSVFPLGEPNAPDRIILTFHLWSFDSELFSVMSRLPLTGSSCALSSSANWYQLILKIRVGRFKSISFLTPPVVQYFWIVVSRLMFTET